MRRTIWKAYYNYEKEEQWLNKMSEKGLALVDYFWIRYVFEDCHPGEYIYRIELLEHFSNHPESQSYLHFVEDMDIEIVGKWLRWVILRKKADSGSFDIYTDYDSRIRHCYRVWHWFRFFAVIEFICFSMQIPAFVSVTVADRTIWHPYLFTTSLLGIMVVSFVLLGLQFRRKAKQYEKEKNIYET